MSKTAAFTPSWGSRLIGMEGLRAIAATGVLFGHARTHLTTSGSLGPAENLVFYFANGLTLFFALSGFLLYRPFATALLTGERFPPLKRYAVNRLLRIYPAYIVITLLASLVLGAAYLRPPGQSVDEVSSIVGFQRDPLLLLTDLTMLQTFFPFSMKTGIGVAWSLTVELVFYVAMPLLAVLAFRSWTRRRQVSRWLLALGPVLALLVLGLVGKAVKISIFMSISGDQTFVREWGGNWTAVFVRSFLVNADLFAFGMLAAVIVAAFERGVLDRRHLGPARLATVAAILVAAVASRAIGSDYNQTALAALFGLVILFVALPNRDGQPGVAAKVLEWLPIRYVGLVSYGIYLWHVPVIWLLDRNGWPHSSSTLGLVATVGGSFLVTLAFAAVTYHLVEKPALSLKKRTDRRRAAQAATADESS